MRSALLRHSSRVSKRSFIRYLSSASTTDLYMWGTDTKGSLRKPPERKDEAKFDIPQKVDWRKDLDIEDSEVQIAQLCCGPTDTAWLLTDGRCFVVGENKEGQLGLGHKNPVDTPQEVKLPVADPETKIQQVSLGNHFSAFVDTAGDLYTCGFGGSTYSGFGALGHGDTLSYLEPKLVESLVEDGCYVKQVQVGDSHMTVLTTEGEVLCCGAGNYGRLGNLDTVDQLFLEPVELLNSGVTQIAGGKSFTLALKDDGVIYGWGRNHKSQLGTGLGMAVDIYAMQSVPEPIEGDELLGRKVTKIVAGQSHAACITESGEMFWWGMNLHLEPVRMAELLHTKVIDIACGQDYTLVLDEEGKLYSYGKGSTGVLGQGKPKQLNQATLMEAFDGMKVKQVAAGYKHAGCLVE